MKRRRNENGQALVEMALVLPLLLMVVCGIIDFGWIFYNQLSIENSCREGARKACVCSTETDYETIVYEKVEENIHSSLKDSLDVRVDYSNPSNPTEGTVTVTVKANIKILTPVFGVFYSGQIKPAESSVVMKVES